jgi:uncharacterized membrane protein YdjX (TVP38/TMEM64 family)
MSGEEAKRPHAESVAPSDEAMPPSRSWLKIAAGLALAALLFLVARQAGGQLPALAAWVEELGVWGPLAFIAAYAIAVVAFVPGSILTLAGGAIFGLAKGTLYVFVAAVIGSGAAFLVARHGLRSAVEERVSGNQKFAAIDRAVGEEGLKITFLLRLSPAFPFSLLNYALGLTRVRFSDYLIASVGMLPGTLLYVYYGKLAGDVAALAGGAGMQNGAGYYTVLALGLAATVAVTALVTRLARRALAQVAVQ